MRTSNDCNNEALTGLAPSKTTFDARASFPDFLKSVCSGAAIFVVKSQTGRSTDSRKINGMKNQGLRKGCGGTERSIGCHP
jgi:hypothetical protein